jgi:hypothetical protein
MTSVPKRQYTSRGATKWPGRTPEQLAAEEVYLRYLDVLYARYHHPSCLGDLMPQVTSSEMDEFNRLAIAAGYHQW